MGNKEHTVIAHIYQAINRCAEDGVFIAAALAEIEQAIDLWIETAQEFGDPIPEPKAFAPAGV